MDPSLHFTRTQLSSKSWIDQSEIPKHVLEQIDFQDVWEDQPKKAGSFLMFGKQIKIPRRNRSYLKDYTFSGKKHKGHSSVPYSLWVLFHWVNQLGYGQFNQIFVNWYHDGSHYIGAHQDNEPEIIPDSPIVSISLGDERTFRVTNPAVKKWRYDVGMPDGTVLVMGGGFQKELKHQVPKTKKSKERRINVTFRQFREQPAAPDRSASPVQNERYRSRSRSPSPSP